jgi:hypothetical protein
MSPNKPDRDFQSTSWASAIRQLAGQMDEEVGQVSLPRPSPFSRLYSLVRRQFSGTNAGHLQSQAGLSWEADMAITQQVTLLHLIE